MIYGNFSYRGAANGKAEQLTAGEEAQGVLSLMLECIVLDQIKPDSTV